jgi:hypothetical protein
MDQNDKLRFAGFPSLFGVVNPEAGGFGQFSSLAISIFS